MQSSTWSAAQIVNQSNMVRHSSTSIRDGAADAPSVA